MTAKRATLSSLSVKAPAPRIMADPPLSDLAPENSTATTIHMTRLTWKALRDIGADQRKSMHALLIEAVGLLFEKYGKDPSHALAGARPPVKPKAATGERGGVG